MNKKLLLLVALAVVLLLVVGEQAMTTHFFGGCNHIPLVNGHPAFACPSKPPS